MAYELFQSKAVKFGSPLLTIGDSSIYFNADAGDVLTRAGMRFAHVLWDAPAHKLAIRPVAKEDANTFRVSIPKGKRGGMLSAQSLQNYIPWRPGERVVVADEWNEKERLLEAILPPGRIEGQDRRK